VGALSLHYGDGEILHCEMMCECQLRTVDSWCMSMILGCTLCAV